MQRNFGEHLRWWRKRRGLSQLELAGVAGTSQRHLSFLESGRAAPSQQMVLNLAGALNVSLRQQNAFLGSAGFAPVWREGKLGQPELAQSAAIEEAPRPLLPIHFRKSDISLRLFSTIATLGTPQDVTVQEIRIESFFPMDDPTARFFRKPKPKRRG